MICRTVVVDRWAFTDQPERQLGAVTVTILIICGAPTLMVLALVGLAIAVLASKGLGS